MVEGSTVPKVNLTEVLEVRGDGLTPSELLSVLASSCEYLISAKSGGTHGKLFLVDQMFLTRNGRVEIQLSSCGLSKKFVPPELQEQNEQFEEQPNLSEAQLVWCLGTSCLRVVRSGHSDVTLFSLLNLMTVGHVQSRPTLSKVWLMVRNQLGVDGLAKVPEVVSSLFKEVMGDLDELLADSFDDDIRFSSSRSSKLSIIPGPGAPEHFAHETSDHQQNLLVSEVTDRLRTEFSYLFDDECTTINAVDIPSGFERKGSITPTQQSQHPPTQQQKPYEHSEDEGELTPRRPTPIPTSERGDLADAKERSATNAEECFAKALEEAPLRDGSVQNGHIGRQEQSVQSIEPQPPKPTGRLYAKAAQTGKVPRAVVKKEPEIEVLSFRPEKRREDLFADSSDGAAAAIAPPVAGFSPGTRQKTQQESDKDSQMTESEEPREQFQRRNSLEPSRCSKKKESFGRRRALPGTKSSSLLPTVPEFLSPGAQPLIRLRAQSMKKKKMVTLHRSDPAVVYVRLLNGHIVEVNCRTDALVGSVFHTVAEHLNITEHMFFGLTLQQRFGENLFLEEDQRLEKWAPPGWKGGPGLRRSFGAGGTLSRPWDHSGGGGVEQFTLLLRFRYYPKKREFVKTATTAHQLYLQLRQDILNGTLRFLPKERAMEMAALALCAEARALPQGQEESFRLEDYLPMKFYEVEPSEAVQTQRQIAELHRRLAASFGYLEAEERFIARCQTESLYGAHFYRVHKIKPKRGHSVPSKPFLSDMRLIAVIPSGIGICREERTGTQRLLNSIHEWHTIRTLQFDRKRFLLGTIEENIAVDHVFYTDHHSKASYLVRFAASQHRFMLKVRQWQGTLNRMHLVQRQKDVGVEQRRRSDDVVSDQQIGGANDGLQTHVRNTSYPQMGIGQEFGAMSPPSEYSSDNNRLIIFMVPRHNGSMFLWRRTPVHGLGLTLIDGDMNGIKTVFVKSLSPEGDGKRKGLLIGDCLLSISLFNKSRHDAVDLVSSCGREVRLELLRFPSVSEVLAQGSPQNAFSSPEKETADQTDEKRGERPSSVGLRRRASNASVKAVRTQGTKEKEGVNDLRKGSTATNESKVSSVSGGTSHSTISSAQRRQRAVSDFGALYLPALKTDDILALGSTNAGRAIERPPRYRRHKTSAGLTSQITDAARRGEYKPHLPPALSMYSFLGDEEDVDETNFMSKSASNVQPNADQRFHSPFGACFCLLASYFSTIVPVVSHRSLRPLNVSFVWKMRRIQFRGTVQNYRQRTLDAPKETTTAITLTGLIVSPTWKGPILLPPHLHLRLGPRVSSADSLPFKVHSLPGKGLFVSEIDAAKMPESVTLRVKDRLVAVDGVSVIGYAWEHVVDKMVCAGRGRTELELTIERTVVEEVSEAEEQTLLVTLDKTQSGAIGLSLAKRMGFEGVFVRNIAPGSIAAREGTLRVGDRIWRVQGEHVVAGESPASVVKRLKDLSGQFSIEVLRRRE
uniref:KIND domain-containing protein n=1 Tax=Globodera pallida TaxID=36090 RepID=A0A183CJS7_GLOPA